MIKIHGLRKKFKKLQVLSDINADLLKGQVIALIGPNGSGKTTLIKCILGLVKPDDGRIYCSDIDITETEKYREQIGYMPQIGRYPDNMKVGQLFKLVKNIRCVEKNIDEELYYKFKLDTILQKPMRTLSGGTRQKVSAALTFMFDPKILILDEPTAGLDPLSAETLKTKIISEKEKGKLILITSHVLSDLEDLATNIMYLQEGKMLFFKSMESLHADTGEEKLSKSIARIMKDQQKNEVRYLKIAK
jgi:Cu-processing system ATP-binding protein